MEKFNTIRMAAEESMTIDHNRNYDLHVGLDVHKATIAIAIAPDGSLTVRHFCHRHSFLREPYGCGGVVL